MGRYTFLVVEELDYEKTELELSGLDPESLGFMTWVLHHFFYCKKDKTIAKMTNIIKNI